MLGLNTKLKQYEESGKKNSSCLSRRRTNGQRDGQPNDAECTV